MMGRYFSVSALLPMLKVSALAMLRAYIDDSGTHAASPVVVIAGFVASDQQWAYFEPRWDAVLKQHDSPPFHASHCSAGDHRFRGWSKPHSDALFHDLRQVIIQSNLWAVGAAVSRRDWEEIVTGKAREELGDADEFCFRMCVEDAFTITQRHLMESELALIFDNREESKEGVDRVYRMYARSKSRLGYVRSLTFSSMKDTLPLQAADMLAYENYLLAKLWVETGERPTPRPHFRNLLDNCLQSLAFAGRDRIKGWVAINDAVDKAFGR